jgi:hypothetical protein
MHTSPCSRQTYVWSDLVFGATTVASCHQLLVEAEEEEEGEGGEDCFCSLPSRAVLPVVVLLLTRESRDEGRSEAIYTNA